MTTRGHHGLLLADTAPAYLDDLAVLPVFVHSLKKLISTATVCMRVRRSSDGDEMDVGFIGDAADLSGMLAWSGSDSVFLKTRYDQTGNGHHRTQATTASQARIVNAGVFDGLEMFDGSDDWGVVPSVPMGTPYLGIYTKWKLPTPASTTILLEQSTNYNIYTQTCVVYLDTATGPQLWTSCQNNTGGGDRRTQYFGPTFGAVKQHTILFDRNTTGTDEEKVFEDGAPLGANVNGTPTDQSGVFSTYDLYVGARAGSSLFTPFGLDTMVIYNADTSAIQSQIESLVA